MRLRAITLRGFRGVSYDNPIEIKDLGNRNIFIGPNNAGKSNVFRFFHLLKSKFLQIQNRAEDLLYHIDVDDNWWWLYDPQQPIQATLDFDCMDREIWYFLDRPTSNKINLIQQNQLKLSIHIKKISNKESTGLVIIVPQVLIDNHLVDIVRSSNAMELSYLTLQGHYINARQNDETTKIVSSLFVTWLNESRFFDPIRAVDRQSNGKGLDDGANLLQELYKLKEDPNRLAYAQFAGAFFEHLNKVISPTGNKFAELEMRGIESPKLYLRPAIAGFGRLAIGLDEMGTGVMQLVVLIVALVKDGNAPKRYFIEEPEVHLHPGLLRRLMHLLSTFTQHQFFISSHSNAILDSMGLENDSIHHFMQRLDGSCKVETCKNLISLHHLLDSLGVSGSTLLQTNCVIWVEGPSDRQYINYWLHQTDSSLQESSDYAFAIYGGKILSNFDLAGQDEIRAKQDKKIIEDLISMIQIARYSAVIMDKDLPPMGGNLASRKQRVIDSSQEDKTHRFACLTNQREIENDLPKEVLFKAVRQILNIDKNDLPDDFDLPQEKSFSVEIAYYLEPDDLDERKKISSRIANKTTLAQKVIMLLEEETRLECPTYINNLVEFIKRSRALDSEMSQALEVVGEEIEG